MDLHWFTSLSTKGKIAVAAGGGGILLLVWQPWKKKTADTSQASPNGYMPAWGTATPNYSSGGGSSGGGSSVTTPATPATPTPVTPIAPTPATPTPAAPVTPPPPSLTTGDIISILNGWHGVNAPVPVVPVVPVVSLAPAPVTPQYHPSPGVPTNTEPVEITEFQKNWAQMTPDQEVRINQAFASPNAMPYGGWTDVQLAAKKTPVVVAAVPVSHPTPTPIASDNQTVYLNNLVAGGGGNAEWAKAQLAEKTPAPAPAPTPVYHPAIVPQAPAPAYHAPAPAPAPAVSNQRAYLDNLVAAGGGNAEWAKAQIAAGKY